MPHKPEPQDESDELVPQDDRAISAGLRWSAVLLVVLLVGGGLGWYALSRRPVRREVKVTGLAAPQAAKALAAASIPMAPFTDITAAAGITFTHFTGAEGEKLLPETMGGGVAFLDFDGDGDQDLFFVNGGRWPWGLLKMLPPPSALYRNDTVPGGPVRFTDVTVGSGLEGRYYGMGAAVGDLDNDGLPDLLVTGVGGARLFRNRGGGKFEDATAAAGVGGDPRDWSTAATWFDLDNDGDLDLFVANYVRWSREIDAEVGYKIDGSTRAYGPPMNFQGAFPHLYRNDGGGRFTEISEAAGVRVKNPATGVPAAKTLGVAAVDLNGDGFADLVVANDTVQNHVFENRRDGSFAEVGARTGIAFDSYGNTRGAMGVDAARFTDDGRLGVVIGNFANEMTALYVSGDDGAIFTDEAIPWGVGPASRLPLKFGVFFLDWDLDGRLDLLCANGHLEEEIAKVQASQRYRQSAQLFWNSGAGGFLAVTNGQAGKDLFTPIVGRGGARADIDGDGDEDVVLTQVGGPPLLLRNDLSPGRNWIRIRLEGVKSNRDGAGAWIVVKAGGRTLWRQVTATRSYLSSSELPVTIGLGDAAGPDSVKVIWPGGAEQVVADVPLRRTLVVRQLP